MNRWPTWSKRDAPVWSGNYWCAGDPSLLVEDDDTMRMFHTSVDPASGRCVIAQAVSDKGATAWRYADVEVAIAGAIGSWDERVEGCCIWKRDGKYWLYYGGYTDAQEAGHNNLPVSGPASLGVAVSDDGLHFERLSPDPIMVPTPGFYDESSVYCPTIGEVDGVLHMVYCAHAYETRRDVALCGATSTDGITWTKRDAAVLERMPELDWADGGVAEPAIRQAPDGTWWMLFTTIATGDRFYTGIARSDHPFGPWTVHTEPLPTPEAGKWDARGHWGPDFLITDSGIRAWWHGANDAWKIQVGYSDGVWQ